MATPSANSVAEVVLHVIAMWCHAPVSTWVAAVNEIAPLWVCMNTAHCVESRRHNCQVFPFGIVVYRIVRPQEKIAEIYERNLAEEALLAEVESVRSCPGCHRRIHDEWIICPTCRTRLNRVCGNCSRLVGLDWSLCAWCGRDFERPDIAAYEPISGGFADFDRLDGPAATTSTPAARLGNRPGALRQPPRPGPGERGAPGSIPER